MVEKIKAVNNPLTIVAIFAALAEAAGTVALGLLDKSVQATFIWFVMIFPILLVLLFFATLNFNPKVLYAPSDFQDEQNFLKTIAQTREVSVGIKKVTRKLEEAQQKITTLTIERDAGAAKDGALKSIAENLSRVEAQLGKVSQKAEIAAWSATRHTRFAAMPPHLPSRGEQQRARRAIRAALRTKSEGQTLDQVLKEVQIHRDLALECLSRMGGIGIVIAEKKNGQTLYRLPPTQP